MIVSIKFFSIFTAQSLAGFSWLCSKSLLRPAHCMRALSPRRSVQEDILKPCVAATAGGHHATARGRLAGSLRGHQLQ